MENRNKYPIKPVTGQGNTLLLEYRGYTCISKRYEDGRWGIGNEQKLSGNEGNNDSASEFDFFCFADNEEEARRIFSSLVDGMIERKEYTQKQVEWKSIVDFKSIAAVINILPEVFEQRIVEGKFDRTLLEGVVGGDYIVPLYYVTKAWDNLLKGSLGVYSFRIGPEEDDDFSEEELQLFLQEQHASRSRGDAICQNDKIKELWKQYFNIDIDAIDVDFTKYDMHLPPNISCDDCYCYFEDVLDGVDHWIISPINYPSEDWCYNDVVSCLMEFTAKVLKFDRNED